jgi:hypothetical protein
VFRSLTNRRFRVKTVTSRSGDLTVVRTGGRGEWVYAFQLQVTQSGPQEASTEFVIQDEDKRESLVVVPVRYHGFVAPGKGEGDSR